MNNDIQDTQEYIGRELFLQNKLKELELEFKANEKMANLTKSVNDELDKLHKIENPSKNDQYRISFLESELERYNKLGYQSDIPTLEKFQEVQESLKEMEDKFIR